MIIKMRNEIRKNNQDIKIIYIAAMCLALNACTMGNKSAMDYLPNSAQIIIKKDIEKGHQADEQKGHAVSVKSMLASILGVKDKETPLPSETVSTLLTASDSYPRPLKKPIRKQPSLKIVSTIDLVINDKIISEIKNNTPDHSGDKYRAKISIGPISEADSAQLAQIQAMAKANAIGHDLKDDFTEVSIKFNPFQPTGTIKIEIMESRDNA